MCSYRYNMKLTKTSQSEVHVAGLVFAVFGMSKSKKEIFSFHLN